MDETTMKTTRNPSVRIDSWATQLTGEQQWALYAKARQPGVLWTEAVEWAVEEFGLKKRPGQSSFFRWKDMMRNEVGMQRMEDLAMNMIDARELAATMKSQMPDRVAIADAFNALSLEAAQAGDAQKSAIYMQNATRILDQYFKMCEWAIKEGTLRGKAAAAERAGELYGPELVKLSKKALATSQEFVSYRAKE